MCYTSEVDRKAFRIMVRVLGYESKVVDGEEVLRFTFEGLSDEARVYFWEVPAVYDPTNPKSEKLRHLTQTLLGGILPDALHASLLLGKMGVISAASRQSNLVDKINPVTTSPC